MYSLSCPPNNSQLILTTTLYRRLGRSLKPSKDPVSCHSPALIPHWAYFSSLASGEPAGTCLEPAYLFVPTMQLAVAHPAE